MPSGTSSFSVPDNKTMLGISDYWAFVAAVLVFLMLPGPGTFSILGSTTRGGRVGGYAALAGLMLGDWLLMCGAMVGVATLLAAHPLAFEALRWAGIGYVAWTGCQLLRSPGTGRGRSASDAGAYFRQGFLITLVNPKAIVFYMAFFPLFIDPARYQGIATLAAIGATVSALTLAYCSALILAGDWASRRMRESAKVGRWLQRAAGLALLGLGARMATE